MKCFSSVYTRLLMFFACTALAACSTVATPQGPSQALAYAYGTVASARIATSNALAAGSISPATAQQVLAATDTARAALDAGEVLITSGSTDTTSIANDIATATSLLQTVQQLLPASSTSTAASTTTPTTAAPAVTK